MLTCTDCMCICMFTCNLRHINYVHVYCTVPRILIDMLVLTTQVTVSPPLSPPVDDTTVKHKPLPSRFSPLPSQALSSVATGTKGSTKSSTKGTTGASSNKPAPLSLGRSSSPSAQSRGYQSLHSPSSTSSGNLSSGGDLLSGGLSSDEHMV